MINPEYYSSFANFWFFSTVFCIRYPLVIFILYFLGGTSTGDRKRKIRYEIQLPIDIFYALTMNFSMPSAKPVQRRLFFSIFQLVPIETQHSHFLHRWISIGHVCIFQLGFSPRSGTRKITQLIITWIKKSRCIQIEFRDGVNCASNLLSFN